MTDPRITAQSQPGSGPQGTDDLVVPAFVVGAAVARGRRMIARVRRLPGLALLSVGAVRGVARATNPYVPVLPWSEGLSPWLIWGRPGRGDEVAAPVTRPPAPGDRGAAPPFRPRADQDDGSAPRSPPPATSSAVAAFGPIVHDRLGSVAWRGAFAASAARPGELPALPHPQARVAGVRAPSAMPPRAAHPAPPPALPPSNRPADLARAPAQHSRPVAAEREPALPGGVIARDSLEDSPGMAPPVPLPERVGDPVVWREALEPGAPVVTRDATPRWTASEPERERVAHASTAGDLPWMQPVERGAVSSSGAERAPRAERAGATGEGLPWSTRSPERPAHAPGAERATLAEGAGATGEGLPWSTRSPERPAPGEPPPLPGLVTGAPVVLKTLVEVTETLRTFVAQETHEVKAAIARVARQPSPPQSPPSELQNDDAARKLLRRMRTLTQEERFRSGKLR